MPAFDTPFLQSYVAPVCRYKRQGDARWVERLHGTAFLIGKAGYFLTARHVLLDAEVDIEKNGGLLGVFPKNIVDGKPVSLTAQIVTYEHAPPPYDISIFRTEYVARSFLTLGDRDIEVWQDIATMGYPASIANKSATEYQVQQRVHKGYIQRITAAGRLDTPGHPPSFELSFPITNGLSGSPLFIAAGPQNDFLIGVCVGSIESRIVSAHKYVAQSESETVSESISRIEEFGLAHDIRPLLDWKPALLNGQSLREVAALPLE